MHLQGKIRVPSDKSLSHRAVLFASLADGTSHLSDILPSDDVLASITCMKALGAQIDLEPGEHGLSGTVTGFAASPSVREGLVLDCGNSGTTTRLLLGILASLGVDATLRGDASLSSRPMDRVIVPLEKMGAKFEGEGSTLPLHILANEGLTPLDYESPKASAQVKSCVLLAGLGADGVTSVTEPAPSRDHTERLLPAFGVEVKSTDLTARVTGPAVLSAADVAAPADPSSAAFPAVAAALVPKSKIVLESVALNPTRIGAFEVMRRFGCDISYPVTSQEGLEPIGDVTVSFTPHLKATRVESSLIPALIDEIPILALLASAAEGETVFESAGELRVKESDRFEAICEGLAALGVEAFAVGDDLHVKGSAFSECSWLTGEARTVELSTRHDHRLAMTWAIARSVGHVDIECDDDECVSVSWPRFHDDMASLFTD